MAQGFLARAGGASWSAFVESLMARRYLTTTRIEGERVYVGLALPVSDGPDQALFEVDPRECGIDAAWLLASGRLDIEAELDAILGSDDE